MNWLCTMSGANYDDTVYQTLQAVERGIGVDKFLIYDDAWLTKHPAWNLNDWLWKHPHKRGLAWYFWKSLIVQETMRCASDGDCIAFLDADTVPIADMSPLYNLCDEHKALIFKVTGQSNRQWTKRDCFVAMGQDSAKYWDSQAAVARFFFVKRGDWKAENFVEQWGTYMTNRRCTTFDKSVLAPENSGFIEHRCDQSVLGLLGHKYGYRFFREACQNGNSDQADWDLYPQVFQQVPTTKHLNVTAPIEGSRYRNVR